MVVIVEEKIYNVNLNEAYKKNDTRRAPYAMRLLRDYIQTHAKVKEVKIGANLNHAIWSKSASKPPHSIRVKAVKDGDVAKVELMGFEYLEFMAKPRAEQKGMKEKLMERLGPKAMQNEEAEKKIEGKDEAKSETSENKTEGKEETDTKPEGKKEVHEQKKPEQHVNKKEQNVQKMIKQDSKKKK